MAKMDYDKIINSIFDSINDISRVDNNEELASAYEDSYSTREQKKRDKKITELLSYYVEGYEKKIHSNSKIKICIIVVCLLIVLGFSVTFIILLFQFNGKTGLKVEDTVSVISVCITFLSLIIGILKIVAMYVFPKNEEEYITRIVEAIQKNDLENKKENIKSENTKTGTTTIDNIDSILNTQEVKRP